MSNDKFANLSLEAEKGRKKLLARFIGGMAIGVLTSSAGLVVLFRNHDAPAVVFAIAQIGVPFATLAFMAYSQRMVWQARTETVRGFLELELERCRDRIRQMGFLRGGLLALLGFVMLFQALLTEKHPGMLSGHGAAVVGLGAPYVIAAWLFWYAQSKLTRLRQEETELTGKLATLDGPHAKPTGAGTTDLEDSAHLATKSGFMVLGKGNASLAVAAANRFLGPAAVNMDQLIRALQRAEVDPLLAERDPQEAAAALADYEGGCDAGAVMFFAVLAFVVVVCYLLPGEPAALEDMDAELLKVRAFGGSARQLREARELSERILRRGRP
jgi:hypothetical protein